MGVALQERPHPASYFIDIGLVEKCTVEIIDMLGEQGGTHAALANLHENSQYLLPVHVEW